MEKGEFGVVYWVSMKNRVVEYIMKEMVVVWFVVIDS